MLLCNRSSSAVDTTSAVKTVTLGGGDLTAAEVLLYVGGGGEGM